MPECIKCNSYTKFEGGLCTQCYYKSESATTATSNGLNSQRKKFHEGMIKGRIAETLIQELFLSMGYNVFRFGMENTIPGITQLLRGIETDVALDIRRMPDFVIQDPRKNSVHFIEVKFRASGEFKKEELGKDYPYTNAHIVLVSKKHIKCLTVKELLEGKELTASSTNYLGNRKEFDLEKEVIIDFCDFAIKFFENV